MTQIINKKLRKCCETCNKYMDTPCAWLSLGNEYCTEIMEVQQEIERLTNNWNKVRQHIKEYFEEWENSDDEWVKGKCDMARDILYDMEEIKQGSNNE